MYAVPAKWLKQADTAVEIMQRSQVPVEKGSSTTRRVNKKLSGVTVAPGEWDDLEGEVRLVR